MKANNKPQLSLITLISTLILVSMFQVSCFTPMIATSPPTPNPNQKTIEKGVFVNPYPAGSYENYKAHPGYRNNYNIYKNQTEYANASPSQTRVVVSLKLQRGILYKGNTPLLDFPISSGKSNHKTPAKDYTILEMLESDKRSNLYGKIYNEAGGVVKSNADSKQDAALIAKPGNRFEGALMAYWMRLSWDGIGMHRGRVPRSPASHGCIRVYSKAVPLLFRKVKKGTSVKVTTF